MAESLQIGPELKPWHERLALIILTQPGLSNIELANKFGRSPVWVSIVRNSDSFKVKMRQLQDNVEDAIISDIPAKLHAIAEVAMERVADHLDSPSCSPRFAHEVANDFLGMLGYSYKTPKGATPTGPTLNQQINVYGTVDRNTLSAARELMANKVQMPETLLVEAQ